MHLILAAAIAALASHAGYAQRSSVSVEQVSRPLGVNAAVRVAPVRGGQSSSSSVQEALRENAAPPVPPEVVEACRQAQAEDRAPPQGVDCMAAMQSVAQIQPAVTAEGSLLELLGQSSNVTGATPVQRGALINADTVARQLATGDVQNASSIEAAAIARQGSSPPPQ
jgi:hypothetical protein